MKVNRRFELFKDVTDEVFASIVDMQKVIVEASNAKTLDSDDSEESNDDGDQADADTSEDDESEDGDDVENLADAQADSDDADLSVGSEGDGDGDDVMTSLASFCANVISGSDKQ